MSTVRSYVLDHQVEVSLYGIRGSYSFMLDESQHGGKSKTEMYAIFAQYVQEHEMGSCTFKIYEGERKEYVQINNFGEASIKKKRKAIRKILAESAGAWLEKRDRNYRYFVAEDSKLSAGYREDDQAFYKKTQLSPKDLLEQLSAEPNTHEMEDQNAPASNLPIPEAKKGNYMPMPTTSSDDEEEGILPTFMQPKKREKATMYIPMPPKGAATPSTYLPQFPKKPQDPQSSLWKGGIVPMPMKQTDTPSTYLPEFPKGPEESQSNYIPLPGGSIPPKFSQSMYQVMVEELDWKELSEGKALQLRMISLEDGNHVLKRVEDTSLSLDQINPSPKQASTYIDLNSLRPKVVKQPQKMPQTAPTGTYLPFPTNSKVPTENTGTYLPFPTNSKAPTENTGTYLPFPQNDQQEDF